MRALLVVLAITASVATSIPLSQAANPKPATKGKVSVTLEAHNEAVEGEIYGDQNLVAVTIDESGIRYQAKGVDKPETMPWAEVTGWRANNFTSNKPTSTLNGDFGLGIYRNEVYFSFRTRNGRDYLAAVKALRNFAPLKERPGE